MNAWHRRFALLATLAVAAPLQALPVVAVNDDDRHLYQIDITTGSSVDLGQLTYGSHRLREVESLTWDPSRNQLFAVEDRGGRHGANLYAVDLDAADGQTVPLRLVATLPLRDVESLTFDFTTNSLLAESRNHIVSIDPDAGTAQTLFEITGKARRRDIEGLALSWDGDTLYASNNNRLYSIDRNTGEGTLFAKLPYKQVEGLELLDETTLLAASDKSNGLFTVDLNTGQAAPLPGFGNFSDLEGLAVIPSPPTASLALFGFAGLALRRRGSAPRR